MARTAFGIVRTGSRVSVLTLVLLGILVARADWPEFRGPTGDGHVSGKTEVIGLPLKWSDTENIKWQTEIPERGWSTPVIMDKQAWFTSATVDGKDFYALCVDTESGKIVYNEKLFHCDAPEGLGNTVNSYATPSPAIEEGRVYIHFGSYGTACLDTTTRKVLWERKDLPCRHYRGPASSVILFENLVILTMDGVDVQYLIALDKKTGKTVWKTNRSVAWNDEQFTDQMSRDGDRRKAHSTPIIVKYNGKLQMICPGAKAANAYDPRTGKELWMVQYDAWSAASMAVCRNGLAYIISGFGGKTELLAVRMDGTGDVTATHVAWKFDKGVSKTASPILVDDLFYMVSDDGMVTCLDAESGKQVWNGRIGGNYAASPIYADDRIYFCNQQGKTTVIKPGRALEILATNTLSSGCMASPAVSGKSLYLRTKTHLFRIEQ